MVAYTTLRNAALSRPDLSHSMTVPGEKGLFPIDVDPQDGSKSSLLNKASKNRHDSKPFPKALCSILDMRNLVVYKWVLLFRSPVVRLRPSRPSVRQQARPRPPAPVPFWPVGRRARARVCVVR